MRFSQNRFRELLLLIGLCGFFFFFRLSGIGLLGPDEPRYAQVAREMLAGHNWVTPVLYGHPWLEKPILLYWGEMLSYRVFGVSDWAARIPSAVAATLLVFGTFLAVRRIRYPARLDAALMIASSVLVLGFARAAATDMLLAAPFCLSLLAWFCWYPAPAAGAASVAAYPPAPAANAAGGPFKPAVGLSGEVVTGQAARIRPPLASVGNTCERSSRLYLALFYALNALAMLAKGPVAPALAAFVLIAFCATQRNWRALWRTLDPVGIAVFLVVAAPWYVLVQLRTPEFFRIFFLEHNLARFSSDLYRHGQPFWYYIPVALVAALPWTVWLFHGLTDAFHSHAPAVPAPAAGAESAAYPPAPAVPAESSPSSLALPEPAEPSTPDESLAPGYTFEVFLTLWALVPIVFFSLSRSKLPGYILPSIPALLILAAVAVHRRAARDERPHRASIAAHALLLAALGAICSLAPRLVLKLPTSTQSLMVAALVGTIVFLIVALPLLAAGWSAWRFVTLLPLILAVGFVLRGLAPVVDATQSARPVAELLQQIGQPGSLPLATFAVNRNTAFGLSFYLNRLVAPYEGLQISPAVYELPAAVPTSAHILITRSSSLPALRLLLGNRKLRFLGSYRAQRLEIYQVSPAP